MDLPVTGISEFKRRAVELDGADELAPFRKAFGPVIEEVIYLDGNSLGPLPAQTSRLLKTAVEEEWGQDLIRSWNAGWFDLPLRLGDKLAPLVGAEAGEVVFCDSVTVNFIKLAAGALRLREGRTGIVTDELNFPSNFYAADGLISLAGTPHTVQRIAPAEGLAVPADRYARAIDENTALVTLSHVVFKSGYLQDLEAITKRAHEAGALVLADLSHSVGSVPIELDRWGVDLAVGCSYKYLNGGPGAPAFLFVRRDLQETFPLVLQGWFGCADPFSFAGTYAPAPGIKRFLVGTPPILSMRAIEPGLDLLNKAGIGRLRAKSAQQSEFLMELWEEILQPLGFALGSPRDPAQRGSHVALRHPEAYRINKAMITPAVTARPVIPDFRRPDNLRLGISPLYLRFGDIAEAVERIAAIVESGEYKTFTHDAETVT